MILFPNECLLNGYHEQPCAIKNSTATIEINSFSSF